VDLAGDPEYASELARLADAHFNWTRQHHSRITVTGEQINARAKGKEPPGILIGFWDKDALEKAGKNLPGKALG
ncbi:MAG: phosphonate monoester hydrolase, partial [Paracoccaceae bacterium]